MTTLAGPDTPVGVEPGPDRPLARRMVMAVAAVAVAVDLVGHLGVDGISGALLALIVVSVASVSWTRSRPGHRWTPILAAAPVAAVGIGTAVRTSTWLLIVDWSVVIGSLPLLGGVAAGRTFRQARFLDAITLGGRWLANLAVGPVALGRLLRRVGPPPSADRSTAARAVLRGLLLAVPVVVATTLLLASGDAVFASFLRLPFGFAGLGFHALLTAAGGWLGIVVVLQAGEPVRSAEVPAALIGRTTELTVVLAGLDLVFALFAAARSIALFRGSNYVQRATHLTYANYARSGFFQLLAVAAIAAVVLLGIVGTAARIDGGPRRRLIALGEIGVVLTLIIVMAAIRRLGLYQHRFGLTMLRLACTWTGWWLGAVFVIIAAALAGIGRSRPWLMPAIVGTLLIAVLAANVANPAAVVARANVSRVRVGPSAGDVSSNSSGLDIEYLISLGDDAQPVLLSHLGTMPGSARRQVLHQICRSARTSRAALDANYSASASATARAAYCPA